VLPLMAKSTRDRSEGVIQNYLITAFGDKCLRDLSPETIQRYLCGLAGSKLSDESRDKVRDVLSSIFGSAVQYGYLVKNPVEGLRLPPPSTGRRSKPFLRPEQFWALMALIPEPYATMVFVAVFTGLRVSELIGLKWRNVLEDSISIEQCCCRGEWGPPKSAASNVTIAVNRRVIERLQRLRTLVVEVKAGKAVRKYPALKSQGMDDLVFQSPVKGAPMRDNNVLVRHLKPAGRKLGIDWLNWQVLRRTYATWLKIAGADTKDAQALMRHARASTTLDIYQQFVPESQRRVVESLSSLMEPVVVN
jgi:integrase